MSRRTKLLVSLCVLLLGSRSIAEEPATDNNPHTEQLKEIAAAREQGLDWLTQNQAADGSWVPFEEMPECRRGLRL
jgi:hypothetical protein